MHTINHAGGETSLSVNQECQSDEYVGQWRPLGSYNFQAGTAGSVTIDTLGSNNQYVGATAVKFIYDEGVMPSPNQQPILTPSFSSIDVAEGDVISVSALALDPEDGDLSASIQWQALGHTMIGADFLLTAGNERFTISLEVIDSEGLSAIEALMVNVIPSVDEPTPPQNVVYQFDCQNFEPLTGFTSNNIIALPTVGAKCGKYVAAVSYTHLTLPTKA